LQANTWLNDQTEAINQQVDQLELPTKSDGSNYNLIEANREQQEIISTVLQTIINWMTGSKDYKPLRMTVSAGAGRGKSYLIHQLTSAIRKIFGRNDAVLSTALTGSAAFNIGGKTCHSSFGISTVNPNKSMTESTRQRLINQLRYIVAIFIDERSMLSSSILGAAERNVAMTCHGGGKQNLDWGGVPVIILWGDDYQLPPVNIGGKGKGAFYCLDYPSRRIINRRCVELQGMLQFQSFSETVFFLTKHQRTDDNEFIDLQDRVRFGEPSQQDIDSLLTLNMHHQGGNIRSMIENDSETVHLFATRNQCAEHNLSQFLKQQSESNPVAMIKNKIPKSTKSSENDLGSIPKTTILCRGAKVCLKGKNFNPKEGLYNGSIGTVIEIVYKPGQSPIKGDFPHYVLVDFPSYKGPSYDIRHPTWVPIPTITTYRPHQTYCPLQLSYARTIHTFQGYQAGPTQNIKKIVCHCGTTKHEALFPGLFYTALSRATTIGTAQDRSKSAVLFTGLTADRIERLRKGTNEKTYSLIKKRDKWTDYLEGKKHPMSQEPSLMNHILLLAELRFDDDDFERIISI
jgi:hypothetical protein